MSKFENSLVCHEEMEIKKWEMGNGKCDTYQSKG